MAKRNSVAEAELLAAAASLSEAREAGDPFEAALADEAAEQAITEAAETVAAMPVAVPGIGLTLTFEQLLQLVNANRSAAPTPEQLTEMATKAALAGADRVKVKETPISQHERKSVFNPLGDRDHPRPKLKCHMYFGAAPLGSPREVTTLTRPEIDALNQLTPGHYRIRKTDGGRAIIEVKGQLNSNQQLDRLWILLPPGDESKNAYPPLDVLAAECNEGTRVTPGL